MKAVQILVAAGVLSTLSVCASASIVTYEVSGVFRDGAELSGTFGVDTRAGCQPQSGTYLTSVNVNTAAGTVDFSQVQTPGTSYFSGFYECTPNFGNFQFNFNGSGRANALSFMTEGAFDLGDLEQSYTFKSEETRGAGDEFLQENGDINSRRLLSGGLTRIDVLSVPEPGTLALIGIAVFGAFAARRRSPAAA